jgi:phage terminase large subunit-like protein
MRFLENVLMVGPSQPTNTNTNKQGPYIFSCQYRLNPVDDDSATFKRSWIATCKISDIPKRLNVYTTVDPMVDEEGKDFLAIVTCGMDEYWRGYLLDVRRLKADEHDTVNEMFDVYKKFKPLKIGIESGAWQKSYYRYVKILEMMKVESFLLEQKRDMTKKKRLRIKGMVPYWKAGLYIVPTEDGKLDSVKGSMAVLVDELTTFPRLNNDDVIDALAHMNHLTKRPSVLHILSKIPVGSFKAIHNKVRKTKKRVLGRYNQRFPSVQTR